MRERRGDRQTHALTAGFAGELEQSGFLFLAGRDEAGVVRELGQRVIPADQRLGKLTLDEAREDVLTFLGEDGGGRVVLGMLGSERLVARFDATDRQQGRMGVEREDAVGLGGELLPGGDSRREVDTLPSALTEFPSRHAHEPFILATLQLDQLRRRRLGEIDAGLLGVAVADLEDASGGTVDAILVVASGSGAAMPELALLDRGYKGKIYQTHAAATPDLIRLVGKAAEGTLVVSGPALLGDQLPDTHPSKKLALDFVNKFEAKFGANTRNQSAGHAYDFQIAMEKAIPIALKKAKPGTPEFRSALRDALETMGRTVFSHGVMNWTAADHWGYTKETGVMLKVVDGKFKVE